jgi:hypothetical protein
VADLKYSAEDFDQHTANAAGELPKGFDGALRSLFDDLSDTKESDLSTHRLASDLIQQLEPALMENVFRWTSHFSEHTRDLLRTLSRRADELAQLITPEKKAEASTALAIFLTSIALVPP